MTVQNPKAEDTSQMHRSSWSAGLSATGDGVGVIAPTGSIALRMVTERTGLVKHLSKAMVRRSFVPVHDRGQVLTDVAVVLAAITMPDVNLRECVNDALERSATTAITKTDAVKVVELDCDAYGVASLAGLENFTNLEVLWIDENTVKSLAPLKGLQKLEEFTAYANNITDLTPLTSLTSLLAVDVAGNAVVDVAPLSKLTRLLYLDLTDNKVSQAAPLATLPDLEVLGLFENPITDEASLQPLLDRGCEIFFDAPIS